MVRMVRAVAGGVRAAGSRLVDLLVWWVWFAFNLPLNTARGARWLCWTGCPSAWCWVDRRRAAAWARVPARVRGPVEAPFRFARWFVNRFPRVGRLILYGVAVHLVFLWLEHHPSTPRQDAYLLLGVALVYALAVLVMVAGTRIWSPRGLGLLGTAQGDSILYVTVSGGYFGWVHPDTAETLVNAARASFVVGSILLAVGLIQWAVATRFNTRADPMMEAFHDEVVVLLKDEVLRLRARVAELESATVAGSAG
jgi:hypothetical protein